MMPLSSHMYMYKDAHHILMAVFVLSTKKISHACTIYTAYYRTFYDVSKGG